MKRSEIIVLTDEEHIKKRPQMYVGSVSATEEKIPIIENNKVVLKTKVYSVGMHKLLDEAIDNAFDEAKRCFQHNRPMKSIVVKIDTRYNMAEVIDTGMGFYKGLEINKKSGINNIETAFTQLRAGSNFENDDIETNLIGTNGVGISCTNVLSDLFQVDTSDGKYRYQQSWIKFKPEETPITELNGKFKSGTSIKFVPSLDIFDSLWDLDLVTTKMIFKNKLKDEDESIKNTKLEFYIDDKLIDLNVPFMPKEFLLVKNTNTLKVYVWKAFESSTSISFVNGSLCTGIHQKMMQEVFNEKIFEYEKAHYFYETMIIVNLPPKNVKFGDQNKTKFVSNRSELSNIIQFGIGDKQALEILDSEWYKLVSTDIENTMKKEEMGKIKKLRRNSKNRITDKYFPSHKKENLFLVEGNSARGSILQKRDPNLDAVYTLRGKLKNTRNLADLSSNQEIIDLMNILDLNLENGGEGIKFKKIIIATDADCLEENTNIITNNGIKNIKDITYDDKILSHTGTYNNILNIIETKKDKYINIELNGEIITCSENHKFIIFRDGEIIEELAKNIKITDFFLVKKNI